MKIWIKDPIQRPQLIERIQKLVDDLNKKKLKATKHILNANKEMEIMVSNEPGLLMLRTSGSILIFIQWSMRNQPHGQNMYLKLLFFVLSNDG